jgi:hypothetical protein
MWHKKARIATTLISEPRKDLPGRLQSFLKRFPCNILEDLDPAALEQCRGFGSPPAITLSIVLKINPLNYSLPRA